MTLIHSGPTWALLFFLTKQAFQSHQPKKCLKGKHLQGNRHSWFSWSGGVWTLGYFGVLSFSGQYSCGEINAFVFCPWNCLTTRAEAIGCTMSAGNHNRWHQGEHAGRMSCLVTDHLTEWDTRRNEWLKSRKVSTGWIITCTLCINYPFFFLLRVAMRLMIIISHLQWRNLSLSQVKCWGYTVSQGKCQVVPKPGCWSPWPWHGMITGLQSGVIRSRSLWKYKQQTHIGTGQKIKAFQLLTVFKISFLTDCKQPEHLPDTVSQLLLETWRISLSASCTAGTPKFGFQDEQ